MIPEPLNLEVPLKLEHSLQNIFQQLGHGARQDGVLGMLWPKNPSTVLMSQG